MKEEFKKVLKWVIHFQNKHFIIHFLMGMPFLLFGFYITLFSPRILTVPIGLCFCIVASTWHLNSIKLLFFSELEGEIE